MAKMAKIAKRTYILEIRKNCENLRILPVFHFRLFLCMISPCRAGCNFLLSFFFGLFPSILALGPICIVYQPCDGKSCARDVGGVLTLPASPPVSRALVIVLKSRQFLRLRNAFKNSILRPQNWTRLRPQH